MILAILRAQLLSLRPRARTRKGGAVFSLATGVVFYGFWAFLGWAVMLYFSAPEAGFFLPALSSALLFVMLYWQLAPVISASFGASLDLRKLLGYPIPRTQLFLIEVLLRITTCGEMFLVLTGIGAGLLRNPLYGFRSAPAILSGLLAFATLNILLAAGSRHLLERWLLRTRFKELFFLLFILIALVPQFLLAFRVPRDTLLKIAPSQLISPWGSAAHLILHQSTAPGGVILLAWLGISWWFGRNQFERSLRFDGTTDRGAARTEPSRSDGVMDILFRLPGRFLPDPVAAMVEKELRTLARIPRFRLVYAMSCFFGLVALLPARRRGLGGGGFFAENALPVMALYGLLMMGQVSYWNSFGFDRSAVQGYFSWPVRFRDALIAKNLTVLVLCVPQVFLVSLAGWAAGIRVTPGKIAEALLVIFIASLFWFGLGNICSVRLPRAMDPARMNQMSNKMQALSILCAPFLLVPLVLAYWARFVFESQLVFGGLLLIAAIVGGIFYWAGLDSAVAASGVHREKMLLELSRADGPLSLN